MEQKKIHARSLIINRKDSPPIISITKNFHLIKRPSKVDSSTDISFFSKPKIQQKFFGSGLRTFFLKEKGLDKNIRVLKIPKARKKILKRQFSDVFTNGLPQFLAKNEENVDASSLINLTTQNKRLKKKILETSETFKNLQKKIGFFSSFDEEND